MNKSESIAEISKALAKFQEEVKQPLKDADNPFFKSKYVPLENVVEAISTYGPPNGLSFVQWPSNDENGRVGVATLLMHTSGEFIEFDPVFMKADKDTPQGAGALITYLKRYSLSAIYGITSDADDDANGSSGNNSEAPKRREKPKQQESDLNNVLTTRFSQAVKVAGNKEQLFEQLGIDRDGMNKLYQSGDEKAKKKVIEQLEGIAQ